MKHQLISIVLASILTAFSYGIGLHYQWISSVNWLEIFSVWTAYWGTYLCVVQTRWNYPINAISVAAFGFLFWQQNLLSSMALQIYLFPWLLYGFFRWRPDSITRPVTNLGFDVYTLGYITLGIGAYFSAYAVNTYFGGASPFWDTSIFALSIVAQLMLDNKILQNWAIWLAIDIIAVPLYWNQDLKVLSIQMGLFGLQTFIGFLFWYRSVKPIETSYEYIPSKS